MNIIVTGCSRGVGLEICRVLLEQGNTVYGIARSCPDEFKALQSEYGGKLFLRVLTFRIVKMSGRMYSKIIAETR